MDTDARLDQILEALERLGAQAARAEAHVEQGDIHVVSPCPALDRLCGTLTKLGVVLVVSVLTGGVGMLLWAVGLRSSP